ncbi:MAG: tRNA (uridine(34)/cytosine(34)/5-carboxymethylaminomethyluridine(34)-2'-O)-methyltransferase TrmL [Pseudomonadota bacterium]
MFHIVLYEPEIPPNTGNIIRLCANAGSQLHLIKPLGFSLNEKKLLRAGLDYHEFVQLKTYENYTDFIQRTQFNQIYAVSTKGQKGYHEIAYQSNTAFLFGPETRGLPDSILKLYDNNTILRVPMSSTSRSLNLSNCVAIILYEALRQNQFCID